MSTYADTMRGLSQGAKSPSSAPATVGAETQALGAEIEALKKRVGELEEVASGLDAVLSNLADRLAAVEAAPALKIPPPPTVPGTPAPQAPPAKSGEVVDTLPPTVAPPPAGQVQPGQNLAAIRELIRQRMGGEKAPSTSEEDALFEEEVPPKKGILD